MPSDGLARSTPSSAGVDAAKISAFLDDVEVAGLELHNLMIWRNDAVVAEAWRWPYSAERLRLTHSMTKSVTACAIGLLIEEGRLALTDRVGDFFPDAGIASDTPQARMTVEDLLTMRAGHDSEVSGSIWRGIKTSWVDEFFRIPVVHEPGTKHVYSSAASYMLSAIVTKVTGQTIDDYLKPRLFEPLGMNMRWDLGPDGINPGGNGISCISADALKLGILHVQKGVWQGRQILPRQWVEVATKAHGVPDYGYHWVVGNGYFAALGVFVQMVIIFPEAKAVIMLNSAMEESRVLLPHLLKHFPAAFSGGGTDEADRALAQRLAAWPNIPPLISATPGDPALLAGAWSVRDNSLGITSVRLGFEADGIQLELTGPDGDLRVEAGHDRWIETTSDLGGAALHHGYRLQDTPTIAGGRWITPTEYELTLHFVETAFRDRFRFQLVAGELVIGRSVNINSDKRTWPLLTATRRAD
jgi:CubicO group peptidase (beta-lactamase class C family)